MTKATLNLFVVYLLWVVATTIGWWAGIFHLNAEAKTYMDIIRQLPIYLADGLLIGFITGTAQALVLRRFTDTNTTPRWIWATMLGYGLAFLMGLIVSVSIPSIVWLSQGKYLLPLGEPSTVSIFLNMDDLFWGGFLIGILQWPVLKRIIPSPNRNKAMLWVLVNWFVLGVSMFVRAFTHGSVLAGFPMIVMGTVMGVFTGLVLLAFLSKSENAGWYGNQGSTQTPDHHT